MPNSPSNKLRLSATSCDFLQQAATFCNKLRLSATEPLQFWTFSGPELTALICSLQGSNLHWTTSTTSRHLSASVPNTLRSVLKMLCSTSRSLHTAAVVNPAFHRRNNLLVLWSFFLASHSALEPRPFFALLTTLTAPQLAHGVITAAAVRLVAQPARRSTHPDLRPSSRSPCHRPARRVIVPLARHALSPVAVDTARSLDTARHHSKVRTHRCAFHVTAVLSTSPRTALSTSPRSHSVSTTHLSGLCHVTRPSLRGLPPPQIWLDATTARAHPAPDCFPHHPSTCVVYVGCAPHPPPRNVTAVLTRHTPRPTTMTPSSSGCSPPVASLTPPVTSLSLLSMPPSTPRSRGCRGDVCPAIPACTLLARDLGLITALNPHCAWRPRGPAPSLRRLYLGCRSPWPLRIALASICAPHATSGLPACTLKHGLTAAVPTPRLCALRATNSLPACTLPAPRHPPHAASLRRRSSMSAALVVARCLAALDSTTSTAKTSQPHTRHLHARRRRRRPRSSSHVASQRSIQRRRRRKRRNLALESSALDNAARNVRAIPPPLDTLQLEYLPVYTSL
ncbi:hypothetical protein C8R45DRAFT_1091278 [Mycena sanguinolenta]|nr:hypothetical protein C8R45DRAFT_1091278 [Mycena sanguinolenta]